MDAAAGSLRELSDFGPGVGHDGAAAAEKAASCFCDLLPRGPVVPCCRLHGDLRSLNHTQNQGLRNSFRKGRVTLRLNNLERQDGQ